MIDLKITTHYMVRVQLAVQEQRDAQNRVDELSLMLDQAREHLSRCGMAEKAAKLELTEYAGNGVRKIYCPLCDTAYAYEPAAGQLEPGCPKCGRASLGQERRIALEEWPRKEPPNQ